MIRLNKVNKHYGPQKNRIRAADDISLKIAPSDSVVITGASGSGKTTLLNLIGGMTQPNSGQIHVLGRDILAMSDVALCRFRAETIGFVFQFPTMFPTLNVIENVLLPSRFSKKAADEDYANALLNKAGLGDRKEAYHFELSEGQKQRVCIARALVNKPSLLLCDEPTGDLDPETETIIMEMIAHANTEGATILLTTHNPALKAAASRTLSIECGRIVEEKREGEKQNE